VSFSARAGQVIAIVGLSGAGKTTLVNLVPRFYDVTGGSILIDGVDIREVTLKSLRRQIGIVTQETVLFDDTIANNIAYGLPEASRESIEAAARAAHAHEFIQALPDKYETKIGERGQRLSGGQRQRLAIARALLKDSPILILDEATSSLDAESELLVQDALANLMRNRTAFVIAHRLSTVRRADAIVALEKGRVAEIGRHEELLARPAGVYAKLYALQIFDERQSSQPEDPALSPRQPS
jgi:subfamily B ATP-binding cassette protein MsbA